ncbi:MAG: hypothetical protein IPL31_07960 [Saprospiraceae bacterium]|nr:hypothetical protein [Saprospiraceae bacterium]
MIRETQIGPFQYMQLHSSKPHDDYHNFKTLLIEVIENGAEPNDLNTRASELTRTIQACANNGNKYAEAPRKKTNGNRSRYRGS